MSRRPWLYLCLLLPVFLSGLTHDLSSPDEIREAEIARSMAFGWQLPDTLASADEARELNMRLPVGADGLPAPNPAGLQVGGSFAVPHLGGRPFLEKPPLFYWLQWPGLKIFGPKPWVVRLPGALLAWLTCCLVYGIIRDRAGTWIAWCSALMLGTMIRYWEWSHEVLIDVALTFVTTLSFYAYWRWCKSVFHTNPGSEQNENCSAQPNSSCGTYWCVVLGAGVGAAFLLKGLVGPVLVTGTCFLHWVVLCCKSQSGAGRWLRFGSWMPIAVVISIPWLWMLWWESGLAGMREVLVANSWGRMVSAYGGHAEPNPFYYLDAYWLMGLPWTLLLPFALWRLVKEIRGAAGDVGSRSHSLWLVCWLTVPLVLLSVPLGKRSLYLMPVLPAQAAVIGIWIAGYLQHKREKGPESERQRQWRYWMTGVGAVIVIVCAVVPFTEWFQAHAARKSATKPALQLQDQAGDKALYLLMPEEREQAALAWVRKGRVAHGLWTVPRVQAVLMRNSNGLFVVPERNLERLKTEFPTWRRHLFPVFTISFGNRQYQVFNGRIELDAHLKEDQPAYVLVHPDHAAGFEYYAHGRKIPHVWGGEALLQIKEKQPGAVLWVTADVPGDPHPELDRVRREWPVFDAHFTEVGRVRMGDRSALETRPMLRWFHVRPGIPSP